MSRPSHLGSRSRSTRGVALVIVLIFVVLVSGIVITFMMRTMTSRQVSSNSVSQSKVEVLANTAMDITIADLRQEIADGSTATTVGSGANVSTLYTPTAVANMMPMRSPAVPGETDYTPNLIRRSVRSDAIVAPGVPSRASAINSETDRSLDGRFISLARWNSHYLLPRFNAGTAIDSTPDPKPDGTPAFTAPDWVLVTRAGPAVQTSIGSGASALSNADSANTNYVVGRYALAIYHEGGLLDVNVAGFPTPTATGLPSATGFTATQVSYKGGLALADLTALPIVKNPSVPADYMTQAQVDALVGWRNNASGKPDGFFPNFTFGSAASVTGWYNTFARGNTNGYLKVYGSATGPTDQAFVSRQQLLKLRGALGLSQNLLQYFGTFTRALEQPSYVPAHVRDPAAPKIIGSIAPPLATVVDTYQGNNDGMGGDDLINPSLLTVRVTSAFTRLDGSAAVVGEPLLKKRVPLSRLALITPTATGSGVPGDPIYDRFGLARSTASSPWTYNHGAANIMTLSQVAAAKREPDFVESLKAAITAGSLAKGGPNLHNSGNNYQYTLDSALDYNVLQIVANLIDQYDTDSYPTLIRMKVPTGTDYRTFRGVEDLPYFYRYHQMAVVSRLPSPVISNTGVAFNDVYSASSSVVFKLKIPNAQVGTLTDPGEATMLYIPDIWNPHDPNGLTTGSAGNRPTQFQVTASTIDPMGVTPAWRIGTQANFDSAVPNPNPGPVPPKETTPTGFTVPSVPPTAAKPVPVAMELNDTNSFMQFTDAGGTLFREPTLLWRSNYPTGSNVNSATSVTEVTTGRSYLGIIIGRIPISIQAPLTLNFKGTLPGPDPIPVTNNMIYQASSVSEMSVLPIKSYEQITFRLQYKDQTGNWVTYDEKYPDLHGLGSTSLKVNVSDYPTQVYKNPLRADTVSAVASGYDPRTGRFGVSTAATDDENSSVPNLEPIAARYFNDTIVTNSDPGYDRFTVLATQRATLERGQYDRYSSPGMTTDPGKNMQMRFFSGSGYSASNGVPTDMYCWDGLWTQNNPAITTAAKDNTQRPFFYEDADGVARRATGAYAKPPVVGSGLGTTGKVATADCAGLPLATANSYANNDGVGAPLGDGQSRSRPIILNRPFRTVAEMGYTFRGGLWKNLDFFTPESGDAALLDVFCIDEQPVKPMVAGKVSLNSRQAPVLQAVMTGAYQDELTNLPNAKSYAAPALSRDSAGLLASALVARTTNLPGTAWLGPLANVSELVGRYVGTNTGAIGNENDNYTFTEPISNLKLTYSGFSADLNSARYTQLAAYSPTIQRYRESAIRPLADAGQVRVWNLLIDVIAQTGRYPRTATTLGQFLVEGEKRYWLHVAIDRYTGEVIDKQIEEVTE